MRDIRTRLALWIAPWLKQPATIQLPTVYWNTSPVATNAWPPGHSYYGSTFGGPVK